MRFKLKMIPPTATAQQKGERVVGGYIHHYKKKNVAAAEAILRDALLPYVPAETITDKPISLLVSWLSRLWGGRQVKLQSTCSH